jgi:hypothetical protein
MSDTAHTDHDLESFEIVHPKHGSARCDERQFADFKKAGWDKPKPSKADKAE